MTNPSSQRRPAEDDTIPEDLVQIGHAMARMRLMIGRRFIGQLAIRKMGGGMELSHIDVLSIIRRSRDKQEVTVGLIAEQMRIDPSRGSRIAADLVKRGIVRRAVSQLDARRSVVEMTAAGEKLLAQIDEIKKEAISDIVADWSPEDRARFATLYERFVEGFEQRYEQFVKEGDISDAMSIDKQS